MSGGIASSSPFSSLYQEPKKPVPFGNYGDPNSFTAAATQQAKDYDQIMKNYQGVVSGQGASPLSYTPTTYSDIAPNLSNYKQSSDVSNSLSNLSGLSQTGGYDSQGIADLRERGISPIRSIYANAQQNLNRNKSIQGGYSPNYAAASAKMTRDEAGQIGKTVTDVNAGIAQNVASNRLQAAPSYANASANANAAQTAADKNNSDIINQINQFNAQNQMNTQLNNSKGALDAASANNQTKLGAIQGQTSLYGTTPALTNTFGNQVMNATQSGQSQQKINNDAATAYNPFGMAGFGR